MFAAAIVATITDTRPQAAQLALVALLAVAMGGQNAIVRRLAVPDITTTVLTMTLTGLAADTVSRTIRTRRAAAVVAMVAGAFASGALLRWMGTATPLWTAAGLLLACAAAAYTTARSPRSAAWR